MNFSNIKKDREEEVIFSGCIFIIDFQLKNILWTEVQD